MKTTLDLPADLLRAIKIRAVRDNRKLKDAVADLLRSGLAREPVVAVRRQRVRLPLVQCAHRADPQQEITAKRAAAILLAEETDAGHAVR
jgi:plasmid stability protein